MKIVIDRDRCNILGVCESIAPDHFEVNDEDELDLLQEDVSVMDRTLIERAVNGCPSGALGLVED